MLEEEDFLLWLLSIPNLTLRRQNILLNFFGSAHDIWYANNDFILSVPGIPEDVLKTIIEYKSEKKFLAYKKFMDRSKISFISKHSPSYPELLKNIPSPPNGFYIMGELPDDLYEKVAIIGSRRYTEYGAYATKKLSYELAMQDIIIVSGMARGIDSVAHKYAIKAGGKTIAVLGCGIDICYPPENSKLRDYIIKNGCIISEFPIYTKPYVSNFPIRNRIISGLCKGVIVVEAFEKSGTFITVGHALDQGREVMAVPGAINSGMSRGTNYLIKNGASLVSDYKDVLEVINSKKVLNNIELNNKLDNKSKIKKINIDQDKKNKITNQANIDLNNLIKDLTDDEKTLYKIIFNNSEPVSFDFIASKIDMPINKISSCLLMLEVKGIIKKLHGQKYIRV